MAMSDAGGDLWSPTAVAVLKRHLGKQTSEAWLEVLGAVGGEAEATGAAPAEAGEKETDADADTGETEAEEPAAAIEGQSQKATSPEQQDLLVQWLLDLRYLQLFLGPDDEALKELATAVHQKSGLENAAEERLAKASQDYFKRTGLLFGLLT